jgi:hypothetical protein
VGEENATLLTKCEPTTPFYLALSASFNMLHSACVGFRDTFVPAPTGESLEWVTAGRLSVLGQAILQAVGQVHQDVQEKP